jgi:hypothetical protein
MFATPIGLLLSVPDKLYDIIVFLAPFIPWEKLWAVVGNILLTLFSISLGVTIIQTIAGLFAQRQPYAGGAVVISRRWLFSLLDNCAMFIGIASGLAKVISRGKLLYLYLWILYVYYPPF